MILRTTTFYTYTTIYILWKIYCVPVCIVSCFFIITRFNLWMQELQYFIHTLKRLYILQNNMLYIFVHCLLSFKKFNLCIL